MNKNKLRFFFQIFMILIIIIFLEIELIKYYINKNKLSNKWEKYSLNPVLGDNKIGTVFDPFVMLDQNNLYRMYVSLRNPGKIALSISENGINGLICI